VTQAVTGESGVEDPLSGATWTQQAEELNSLPIPLPGGTIGEAPDAEVTATRPSETGTCSDGKPPRFRVRIFLDGNELLRAEGGGGSIPAPLTETRSVVPIGVKFGAEPGKATNHTFTARVDDACITNRFETPPYHYTINSVTLDVIGIR
jgi:hypothetical protein